MVKGLDTKYIELFEFIDKRKVDDRIIKIYYLIGENTI